MKKVLLFALIIIIAGCTKTPQEKAEKLIRQWAQSNLSDPASYQPESYEKMDSMPFSLSTRKYLFDFLLPTLNGNEHKAAINKVYYDFEKGKIEKAQEDKSWARLKLEEKDAKEKSLNDKLEKQQEALTTLEKYIPEYDSIMKNPTFSGFSMKHAYKAKNALGAYNTEEKIFFFNTSIDSLLAVEEVGKYNDSIFRYGMPYKRYKATRDKYRKK